MNEERKKNDSVPYIVHESIMARMERAQKRLFILCVDYAMSAIMKDN